MEKIVVLGYGGHAKVIMDSIVSMNEYEIVGYTDVEDKKADIEYLGNDDCLEELFNKGISTAVIGMGYLGKGTLRDDLYKLVKKIGYNVPAIIDKSAILSRQDVSIGEGTFIAKRAVINPGVKIGNCCIINTGGIVEHDCEVGDFSHVSVSTVLCGEVTVGSHCFIGANSTVIQCRTIGDNCIVGAGSVVRRDMRDNERYV